jgi:hypothetical protein
MLSRREKKPSQEPRIKECSVSILQKDRIIRSVRRCIGRHSLLQNNVSHLRYGYESRWTAYLGRWTSGLVYQEFISRTIREVTVLPSTLEYSVPNEQVCVLGRALLLILKKT